MVLVYVAVAIVLSLKRKILGVTSAEKLKHLLDTVSFLGFNQSNGTSTNLFQCWSMYGTCFYSLSPFRYQRKTLVSL